MKKELFIAIILGLAGLAYVGIVIAQAPERKLPKSTSETLSALDVADHAKKEDCWVIVSGNVYDVTALIPDHSGGEEAIISACGGDATEVFDTKGGKEEHSEEAQRILEEMYIGALE